MGNFIEEETEIVDNREDTGIRNIPSTSAAELEAPLQENKRRISKEEVHALRPMRRRRTISVAVAESVRERWENIEANIEFPIMRPKVNVAPQEPVAEEPQIEGLLFENGLLKEEVHELQKEVEIWKETCQKQVERRFHSLVEDANQIEGSL